jgi:hypothetical protein
VRRAVYEAVPAGWRLGAHERCAELLARQGASAADRAHHVEQAARYGDTAAIAILKEAGDTVAQRTPAGAARWFGAALRLLPDTAPSVERVALLTARAGALAATGQFADALSDLIESLRLLPADAVAQRVQLTTACAGLEQLLGRHHAAHASLTSAVADLDQPTSAQGAALMITLGTDAFYRLEYDSLARGGPARSRSRVLWATARSRQPRPVCWRSGRHSPQRSRRQSGNARPRPSLLTQCPTKSSRYGSMRPPTSQAQRLTPTGSPRRGPMVSGASRSPGQLVKGSCFRW